MLLDLIGHPSKKLWSFVLAQSFSFQFQASRYVTGINQTSEKKVIVVCIGSELQHSISCVSICYGTQSDIRVKSYGRLYWLRASTFNFKRLDMLRDSIRHPSKKLWSFVLAQSFNFQFQASRYVTGINQTSEKKVIVVCIGSENQHSISCVSICYGTQSDIREKSYCRLRLLRDSTFNFESLDILRDSIRHPSITLWSFVLAESFNIQFRASRYVTGLSQTSE